MSRKGNGWDNAVMERFFLNLKMGRVWQREYANHAEAQADIADYITRFYNPGATAFDAGIPSDYEPARSSPLKFKVPSSDCPKRLEHDRRVGSENKAPFLAAISLNE